MNLPDKDILSFIQSNTVTTVSFCDTQQKPYSVPCFFVADEQHMSLILKSSPGTFHGTLLKAKTEVSGSILPDQLDVLKIQGIQYKGTIEEQSITDKFSLPAKYYAKYPIGISIPGYIWLIRINWLKFTDNTKGFGHKIIWNRD